MANFNSKIINLANFWPRWYKPKTGVECHGYHPKVPLDMSKETRGEVVKFLEQSSSVGDVHNKLARRCFESEERHKGALHGPSPHTDLMVEVVGRTKR